MHSVPVDLARRPAERLLEAAEIDHHIPDSSIFPVNVARVPPFKRRKLEEIVREAEDVLTGAGWFTGSSWSLVKEKKGGGVDGELVLSE